MKGSASSHRCLGSGETDDGKWFIGGKTDGRADGRHEKLFSREEGEVPVFTQELPFSLQHEQSVKLRRSREIQARHHFQPVHLKIRTGLRHPPDG